MLSKRKNLIAPSRIIVAQLESPFVFARTFLGPCLPGLNVRPLQVEQRQPTHDVLPAFEVEGVGCAQHILEMFRVPALRDGAFRIFQPGVGEETGEIVQAVAGCGLVPLYQTVLDQSVERVLCLVRLKFPNCCGRCPIKSVWEYGQYAPQLLEFGTQQLVTQAERCIDQFEPRLRVCESPHVVFRFERNPLG